MKMRVRHLGFKSFSFAVPALVIFLLAFPVLSGFLGTLGPALGYLPALGGTTISFSAFLLFFEQPGIWSSIILSLASGLIATFISFALIFLFVASYAETRLGQRIQRLLSPLLSIPHASAAFGLSFLLAPSGLVARLISPWATGWDRPPDLQILNDDFGIIMVLGLVVKEVPFLFLMALAALPQIPVQQSRQVMVNLGYGRISGFLIACGPPLYRQLRLPLLAVLAFSVSVADVAMILGPQLPPTLAVRITRWMSDPDLQLRFVGSAGAIVQIAILLLAMVVWGLGELTIGTLFSKLSMSGMRGRQDRMLRQSSLLLIGLSGILVFASLFGLVLWSLAGLWPFPKVWPDSVNLSIWMRVIPQIMPVIDITIQIAVYSAGFSLVLVILLLWCRDFAGQKKVHQIVSGLVYLPLVVPQLSFVFGLQVLFLTIGFQPGLSLLVVVHMIFVFPYVFLSLKDPWQSLDRRFDQLSLSFGKSKLHTLVFVRLPILLRPVLTSFAVGLAVSIGLYLPTLLIGAGRLTTITTEAVALSSGGDRRVIGVYSLVQTILPFAGFFVASLATALLEPRKSHRETYFGRR